MTAPSPLRVTVTACTAEILRRCYRGEQPDDVLERAAVMLATADGQLDTDGRIKSGRRP